MTLKQFYYSIRPMAAARANEKFSAPPALYLFLAAAFVSVMGGFASGFGIWLLVGFSPDNSGGSLIFVFGSCTMTLLSLVLAQFWKNQAALYGLNLFSFLTVLLITLSIRRL